MRHPDKESGVIAIPKWFDEDASRAEQHIGGGKKIRTIDYRKNSSSLDFKYSGGKIRVKVTDWATESRQLSHVLNYDKNRNNNDIKRKRSTGRRSKLSSSGSSTSWTSSTSTSDLDV